MTMSEERDAIARRIENYKNGDYEFDNSFAVDIMEDARMLVDVLLLAAASEVVICAAIKLDDGYIVRGHRHDDCIRTAAARGDYPTRQHGPICADQQGFVTSRNRFVNRDDAMAIQKAAGLPSADLVAKGYSDPSLRGDILFSEDVY